MKFYITRPELHADVAPIAFNVDRTPTLHYYGTLELAVAIVDRCDNFWEVVIFGTRIRHENFDNGRLVGRATAERLVEAWAEARGLVRYDDERADREAEAGALYRAEMRHSL